MPSKDPSKVIRSPSFRAKLQQITGLSAEEKALFLRVGNLIDFLSYSTIQESNPQGKARALSNTVPVPANVLATSISGGFVLTWDPVDYTGLSFYEVQISDNVVFSAPQSFQVIANRFDYRQAASDATYIRIRTVGKNGEVSAFSSTATVSVEAISINVDYDFIDPENRTTVLPKPTLVGATTALASGTEISAGVGAVFAGSPLTLTDNFSGFPGTGEKRNEITYDLMERTDPFPSLEQRISGPPDHFIESSDFYTLVEPETGLRFYIDTFIYPSSFVDFFATQPLVVDPSSVDIEFLRYRIVQSFYFPDFSQTGIVQSATMAALKI